MSKDKRHLDIATAPLPHEVPWITNEVNGFVSYRCPDGVSGWARSPNPNPELRPGLRYSTSDEPGELEFFRSHFLGLESPELREEWFLRCYVAMRQRGAWDVNIAAEQRLADQRAEILSELPVPPGPAAIQ